MKQFLIGACAVMLLTAVAFAQTAATNPPPPAQDQQVDGQQADGQQSDGGGWFSGGRRGHRGHHGGRGDMMMQGGNGKGFNIMVGPGHGLHINCGDEPMKDCIAAAQPLIDALGKLDFKMPPPPVGAVPPAQ